MTGRSRLLYVDWLRGVAVLCMIVWHAVDAWIVPGDRQGPVFAAVGFFGGWAAPLFLFSTTSTGVFAGALVFGFCSIGGWGIVPGYLAERFPTEARGVGTGFTYHVGVGVGSYTPYLIGWLQDGGTDLRTAMLWCILSAGALVIVLLWLGPETRGRNLE